MATEAQLVARVLKIVRELGTGQPLPAEISASVIEFIPWKLADLAQRSVIYIADSESVPDAAVQWLAMAIANDMAEDFGLVMDAGKKRLAEAMLREIQEPDNGGVVRAEYY